MFTYTRQLEVLATALYLEFRHMQLIALRKLICGVHSAQEMFF